MDHTHSDRWIAFAEQRRIAEGAPPELARKLKRFVGKDANTPVLVFDARSSQPVELDLRGSLAEVLARLPGGSAGALPSGDLGSSAPARGPGRPRLGVVAREVTLLPRHWHWLAAQSGGASVALRKLVEQGMRAGRATQGARAAQESAYRFMSAIAGNEPGFEEAARALFAGDLPKLAEVMRGWPVDVRKHTLDLANTESRAGPAPAQILG